MLSFQYFQIIDLSTDNWKSVNRSFFSTFQLKRRNWHIYLFLHDNNPILSQWVFPRFLLLQFNCYVFMSNASRHCSCCDENAFLEIPKNGIWKHMIFAVTLLGLRVSPSNFAGNFNRFLSDTVRKNRFSVSYKYIISKH